MYDAADHGISPSGFLNVKRMTISVSKNIYSVARWTLSLGDANHVHRTLTHTHYSDIEDYKQVSYTD